MLRKKIILFSTCILTSSFLFSQTSKIKELESQRLKLKNEIKEINSLLNEEALSTDEFNGQMCSFYYKPKKDLIDFNIKFYLKYKIQLPFIEWNNKTLFRISIQAYNSKNDINVLLNALDDLK